MVGRAQLVLVVGFAAILGALSFVLTRTSAVAGYNSVSYFDALTSHNIAVSAAQAGLAKVESDTSWFGVMQGDLTVYQGSYTVTRDSAEPLLMRCVSTYTTSIHDVLQDTVEVYFADNNVQSFSLMSWMTGSEGNVQWISGDSVFGKLHTNGTFRVNGGPVFTDRVTTTNGFIPPPGSGSNKGVYQKGWQLADSIRFPDDLLALYSAAVDTNGNGHYYDVPDLWVQLNGGNSSITGDGVALVSTMHVGPVLDTIPITGDGTIIMGPGLVHVQGTLDGALTVASFTNLLIENDLIYEQDPRTDPKSPDVLGLVAEDSVLVADNATNADGVTIDASIFARNGAFAAQNYDSGVLRGRLSVLGSIVQSTRGPVGTNIAGVPNSGYMKSYTYDRRLADSNFRPPSYPGYRPHSLPIVGWWESLRVPDYSKSPL